MQDIKLNEQRFAERLESLMCETASLANRKKSDVRPFICSGKPTECDIFVLGTNPASTVSWASFWNAENEIFDKTGWIPAYEEERVAEKRAQGRSRVSRQSLTRRRIEILINTLGQNHHVLETNVFSISTRSEKNLMPADRVSEIFEFLLQTIKPKALFVHGSTAASYLRSRYQLTVTGERTIASFSYGEIPLFIAPHLAARKGLVTHAKVFEWGEAIKAVMSKQ